MDLERAEEIRESVINAVVPAAVGCGGIDISAMPDCGLLEILEAMEVCRNAPRVRTETGEELRAVVAPELCALAYAMKQYGGLSGILRMSGHSAMLSKPEIESIRRGKVLADVLRDQMNTTQTIRAIQYFDSFPQI